MSAAIAHHPTTSLVTTMQQKNKTIGVMGPGKEPWLAFSEPLGAWLAQAGFNLLTGGGQGVMLAVARAFAGVPGRAGRSIGILPTQADPLAGFVPLDGYPHPFVDIPILTPLPRREPDAAPDTINRNYVNVLSSDLIVALPGSPARPRRSRSRGAGASRSSASGRTVRFASLRRGHVHVVVR